MRNAIGNEHHVLAESWFNPKGAGLLDTGGNANGIAGAITPPQKEEIN